MISPIGYTGFVGSNIYAAGGKYLADHNPEKDMELVIQAEENIEKINPQRLVLIYTIDVKKRRMSMKILRLAQRIFMRMVTPDPILVLTSRFFGNPGYVFFRNLFCKFHFIHT